ncbi:MAG: hypothetical protein GX490_07375 [Bacilli bacterium]|nr:hypothetical protein [Bacilli bacterium]
MNYIVYALFAIIPLIVIFLIIFIIVKVLSKKNSGRINYGRYAINILENNTTVDETENG